MIGVGASSVPITAHAPSTFDVVVKLIRPYSRPTPELTARELNLEVKLRFLEVNLELNLLRMLLEGSSPLEPMRPLPDERRPSSRTAAKVVIRRKVVLRRAGASAGAATGAATGAGAGVLASGKTMSGSAATA